MNKTRKILRIMETMGRDMLGVTPYVNYGGCGIVAAMVGREMQKLGFEVDVVTPTNKSSKTSIPAVVRNKLKKKKKDRNDAMVWSSNGLSRAHLALRFKIGKRLYTWDTDVLHRDGKYFGDVAYYCGYRFGRGLTVRETSAMCVQKLGWNETFPRDQIPELRKIVKDHMEHINRVLNSK